MRQALILAFVVGLVLKLLHFPYHTVLLLVVVALGIGTNIPGLRGTRKPEAWCRLAFWTWLLHLVALLKLFPFRTFTLILAAAATLVAVVVATRERPMPSALRQLAGAFIVVMLVMAVPTSTRFYFTNLRFSLEQESDYQTWDKYSFFLLREGRTAEALTANSIAIEAAMTTHDEATADLLQARRERIEGNTWEHFTPLKHGH
jgi:hypothetical protein